MHDLCHCAQVGFDGPEWSGISAPAKELITKMLDRDWNSRITAAQALEHPWIQIQCGETGCVLEHSAVDMEQSEHGSLQQ